MLFQSALVAFAALAGLASAQGPGTTCCNLTDPGSVADQSGSWCTGQQNACKALCGDSTLNNTCTTNPLTYNCTCFDATTPNISDYANTLPSYECQAWIGQCIKLHPDDAEGQAACNTTVCGSKNASLAVTSSSSSSAAPSSTSASSSAPASSSAAPSSSNLAAPIMVHREATTGVVGAILFGIFGFLL